MIPTECTLWKQQSLTAHDLYDRFDEVHVFHQNPDSSKRLLSCKECGQLYIYEYTGSGKEDDPSLEILYLPVRRVGDTIEADSAGIPRMIVHWPRLQAEPSVYWVRE